MMADVIKTLRAELATLELKIQRIRELLALYTEDDDALAVIQPESNQRVVAVSPPTARTTKAKQKEDAIREFLEPRGTVHRKEILEHLTARGFMRRNRRSDGGSCDLHF